MVFSEKLNCLYNKILGFITILQNGNKPKNFIELFECGLIKKDREIEQKSLTYFYFLVQAVLVPSRILPYPKPLFVL